MKVCFVYISLSGNTESFVRRLSDYLWEQYPDLVIEKIHVKDLVKEGKPFFEVDTPFIAFLPTYLEGGNGVDNGDVEILTTDVADFEMRGMLGDIKKVAGIIEELYHF